MLTAALTSQGRLFIRLFIVSTGGDEGVRAGVKWSGESDSREKKWHPSDADGPERSFSLVDFARIIMRKKINDVNQIYLFRAFISGQ